MKTVGMIKIAASTMVLGAALAPVNASNYGQETGSPQKVAAQAAKQANKAMAKSDFSLAVARAEVAVAAMPRNAGYRALLGQAYLSSGRFVSAETVLGEAASLDPSNARTGLNLALAQIANNHKDRALATLDAYRERLAAADYGLAVALAGDVDGALRVLENAARAPGADAKVRQNLALTYAMADRWVQSRVMASQDLSPHLVDARMTEWASFVHPQTASQQVASLMRVTPVADPGQPTRLALGGGEDQQVAAVAPAPVAAPVEEVAVASFSAPEPVFEVGGPAPAPAPVAVAAAAPAPSPVADVAAPVAAVQKVIFGPSVPVVQAIPASYVAPQRAAPQRVAAAPLIKAQPRPLKQAVVPAGAASDTFRPVESGQFVVQLGAFSSEARAQAAWNGMSRRSALEGLDASTARVKVKDAALYRLSVSGFTTRAAAGQVCAKVKAAGGNCFVRSVAGDAPLQWANAPGGTRLASRK